MKTIINRISIRPVVLVLTLLVLILNLVSCAKKILFKPRHKFQQREEMLPILKIRIATMKLNCKFHIWQSPTDYNLLKQRM